MRFSSWFYALRFRHINLLGWLPALSSSFLWILRNFIKCLFCLTWSCLFSFPWFFTLTNRFFGHGFLLNILFSSRSPCSWFLIDDFFRTFLVLFLHLCIRILTFIILNWLIFLLLIIHLIKLSLYWCNFLNILHFIYLAITLHIYIILFLWLLNNISINIFCRRMIWVLLLRILFLACQILLSNILFNWTRFNFIWIHFSILFLVALKIFMYILTIIVTFVILGLNNRQILRRLIIRISLIILFFLHFLTILDIWLLLIILN